MVVVHIISLKLLVLHLGKSIKPDTEASRYPLPPPGGLRCPWTPWCSLLFSLLIIWNSRIWRVRVSVESLTNCGLCVSTTKTTFFPFKRWCPRRYLDKSRHFPKIKSLSIPFQQYPWRRKGDIKERLSRRKKMFIFLGRQSMTPCCVAVTYEIRSV